MSAFCFILLWTFAVKNLPKKPKKMGVCALKCVKDIIFARLINWIICENYRHWLCQYISIASIRRSF